MKNRPGKPNVLDYQLANVYLADLIEWHKSKGISLRSLSIKLNISPSLLSLIVNGKRPVVEENIDIWAEVFKWNPQEVSWLKQIIILENSSPDEKRKAFENLSRFNNYKEKSSPEILTYKYLKHWWNVAIREMSSLPDFQEDEGWIQRRLLFTVSLNDIRKSVKFLSKHKLLAKYGNFRFLDCDGNVYKLALATFHNQLLTKAVESIHKLSSEERYILGHTVAINSSSFSEARVILDEAMEKLKKLESNVPEKNEVYHFSVLGFPLTKKNEL